ncbi:MAG: hypothetical protein J7J25_03685, partial [Candidatus Omnitrophica bacterium]|nr:hypothetical protein [Candidatus Omnitrophota bacterium]
MSKVKVLMVLFFFIFFTAVIFPYPEKLDNAHMGPASGDNPFFGNVITNPITSPSWFKVDTNLYVGPTQRMYYYNNQTGIIEHLTEGGKTKTISDSRGIRTYDKYGHLLRYYHYVRDANGNIIRIDDYVYTSRYDNGKLKSYKLIRRDADGNIMRIYDYSGFTYDENGRVSGYTRTDRDADGNTLRSYEYA